MKFYIFYAFLEANCEFYYIHRISKSQFPRIIVKLLVSINRKEGYKSAKENVDLAIQLMKQFPHYVVGVDLSGDPKVKESFLPLLEIARKTGLKVAAHCAEVIINCFFFIVMDNIIDTIDMYTHTHTYIDTR